MGRDQDHRSDRAEGFGREGSLDAHRSLNDRDRAAEAGGGKARNRGQSICALISSDEKSNFLPELKRAR